MRDLTRTNAKLPAYKMLSEMHIKNFTPLVNKIFVRNGKKQCEFVPFMHDLVFVYDTREVLDPIVAKTRTFQYRFLKGRVPMTVRDKDMNRFITAVSSTPTPKYYSLSELTPDMRKCHIRIIGGVLDGLDGYMLSITGSKEKRLLVELPNLLAASVEVQPDLIELL